ncbi:MAG TPA: M13 family peptidase, partial [Candidatus Avibacteroides faecavium]|nr:M13 family peptidase [Candidatus Avibacteroides faecavium]
MKRKTYLPIMAAALVSMAALSGCKQQAQSGGIRLENMDTTVVAGNDFYQYACGGWIKANPITPEYSRFGSFEYLGEQNLKQIRELIEGIAAKQNQPGSIEQKIGDLYNMAMDTIKRNNDKATPIQEDLKSIEAITSKDQLPATIASLQRIGVSLFFQPYVGADEK